MTTNILIVGNGFDLSHFLPTKYDHFMDAMKAIEEKDTGTKPNDLKAKTIDQWIKLLDETFEKRKEQQQPNYQMSFDELFADTRDEKFIEKTKEFYLTEQINLSSQDVIKLQYRLALNNWYQYFKNYVEEIKTWIDFEKKIEEMLTTLANCILDIEQIKRPNELFRYFIHEQRDGHRISERNFKILNLFMTNLITINLFQKMINAF